MQNAYFYLYTNNNNNSDSEPKGLTKIYNLLKFFSYVKHKC